MGQDCQGSGGELALSGKLVIRGRQEECLEVCLGTGRKLRSAVATLAILGIRLSARGQSAESTAQNRGVYGVDARRQGCSKLSLRVPSPS